jgi:hypothetical protein
MSTESTVEKQSQNSSTPAKSKQYRIYKPNPNNNGAASYWQLSYKDQDRYNPYKVFLVVAKQIKSDNDNAKFDWDNGINVKLEENDLGEIIAVLDKRKESLGSKGSLFHKTPSGGNKVISLDKTDAGYSLKVSSQDQDKNTKQVFHSISIGEAAVLSTLLKQAIIVMHGWW